MSNKPSWRHFQLVLLIGCGNVFRLSDCLVLNAINGQTFSPNASAKFECIIDPYTFSQTWYVDSTYVADCGIFVCSENASNPGRYSFTPNTSAGHFIFKIDPISLEDNDNVIRCFDGTYFKETSISVTDTVTTATTSKTVNDNGGSGGGGGGGEGIPYWVWIILVFVAVIIIVIVCCCCKGTNIIYCSNSCDRKQQSADMKTILRDWISQPKYCCVILQGLLDSELFGQIVKETNKVLSAMKPNDKQDLTKNIQDEDKQIIRQKEQAHHYMMGQREQEMKLMQERLEWITQHSWMEEENLKGNETDVKSKMQELVKNTTFSSHIMKDEGFSSFIMLELQKNTDKYKKLQQGIEKARQDHTKK